ncbi:hypothetical protein RvY_04764 [Ramazzottius varieornatus]|uniref:Phosphodiesterase n=1 Tax=Ramazzottius varieornatus TaxID=947166 RepID=A0A1D1UZE1_RAMVA|nr:hypothetical protein RvY_04764 [Ramazzottius varieornatus]
MLNATVLPDIKAPKESFQVNSSLLIHPSVKTRFDPAEPRDKVELEEGAEEGAENAGGDPGYTEEEKSEAMVGTFPESSDFSIIYDYAQNYGKAIWAEETSVYSTDHGRDTLRKMGPSGASTIIRLVQKFPALEAVKIGKALLRNHIDHDLRYAIMTNSDRDSNIRHLMAIPLRDSDDVIRGAVEFTRTWNFSAPFPEDLFIGTVEDITFFANMVWRGADCRREVNTYRILGARFQELYVRPANWDNVLYKFMVLIKSQMNADRVHLFRMNHHDNIAVASVYDTGKFSKQGYHYDYSKEVTLPIKETFFRNIQYLDDSINVRHSSHAWIAQMGLDNKLPGPPVCNFLAMAFNEDWEGRACEVLLLVNSAGKDGFTQCEENVLRSLMSFCYSAMGTHYFRHRMSVTSRPLKLEEELFFKLCNENRADSVALGKLCDESFQPPEDFFTYDFYCAKYLVDDFALPGMLVFMLDTLFGPDGFHREKLMSFVLAVREGYRNIRYHTWPHGFHVAHCLFVILYTNANFLNILERKALMIAGVCHDLDHFGYNNSFTKRFSTAFDTLYTASHMEHHHIRETFRLMSSTENDILSGWSDGDKSQFAFLVKQAILATDQMTYFAEKNTLEHILHTKLDIDNADHRQRVMNLMMSSSDLVVSAKPWEIHRASTEDLYYEFHQQGDTERLYGDQPMPMMDRDNYPNMPKDQIGYLKHIVLPMFTLLATAIPNTAELVHGCVRNITAWEEEVARRERRPEEAAGANKEVQPSVQLTKPGKPKRLRRQRKKGNGGEQGDETPVQSEEESGGETS